MWPASQTGDTNADNDTNNALSQETPGLDLHWGRDAVDMDLLNELLGTISNHPSAHDTDNEGIDGTQEITTEAVLQGLRSLDEFEQQAAQTDTGGHSLGFGSFNEAELSAALEQIYWGSLSVPSVDPAEISVPATDFGSPIDSPSPCAPTPVSTPVVCEPSYTNDDDGNSMELEELSLFSLFLSDMSAFEGFLQNLSLNQLRQCAATVNSVLVQREKHAPVEADVVEAQGVGESVQTGE
ncbi:hypothetical protein IW139_005141, partial [Coemansia sp. RSA 353]